MMHWLHCSVLLATYTVLHMEEFIKRQNTRNRFNQRWAQISTMVLRDGSWFIGAHEPLTMLTFFNSQTGLWSIWFSPISTWRGAFHVTELHGKPPFMGFPPHTSPATPSWAQHLPYLLQVSSSPLPLPCCPAVWGLLYALLLPGRLRILWEV